MKITVTILFDRRKRLTPQNTTDTAPVELYIYQSQPRLRKYVTTSISIEQQFWDSKKNMVSTRHPNAPHFNKIIRDTVQTIEDFAYGLYAAKKVLTSDLLTQLLSNQKISTESFTQFFEQQIDPALKRGTRKEHEYTLNVLKEFRHDILFAEISYSLIQEFDRFMRFDKKFMQNT
ncbi:MAG TPA: phage integrase SAM-like domain-containing protein, partial [Perlabentimonas sp.]|nr:phage integrase SAM-like domain-containing protein [Perlabentimonas sp.]